MTEFLSDPTAVAALEVAVREVKKKFCPPPELTVSQWADQFRRLSTVDSAEPGAWRTDTAEYQRGVLDAFTDLTGKDIVLICSGRFGKSACLLNFLGFVIAVDPGPTMVILPTQA